MKLFKSWFFYILSSQRSISWLIKSFFRFMFPEIYIFFFGGGGGGEAFFEIQKKLNIRARKFHYLIYKKFFSWWIIFISSGLDLKKCPRYLNLLLLRRLLWWKDISKPTQKHTRNKADIYCKQETKL